MATIKGINDDVTTCECCGRTDLKKTVIIDCGEGDIRHYGVDCAAAFVGTASARLQAAAEREEAGRDDRLSAQALREHVRSAARHCIRQGVVVRERIVPIVEHHLGSRIFAFQGAEAIDRVCAVVAKYA